MIGLLLKTEPVPDDSQLLGEVNWNGLDYLKLIGENVTKEHKNDWKKYKGTYRVYVAPNVFADPMDIIKIMPDDTLAELQDQAVTKANANSNRGKAYKIISILGQSQPLEVSSSEFDGYLVWMRDNTKIPSFDQAAMDELKSKLSI